MLGNVALITPRIATAPCVSLWSVFPTRPEPSQPSSPLNLRGLEQCLARNWHLVDGGGMIDSGRRSLNSSSEFPGRGRRILHRCHQGASMPVPRHRPGPLLAGGHPGTPGTRALGRACTWPGARVRKHPRSAALGPSCEQESCQQRLGTGARSQGLWSGPRGALGGVGRKAVVETHTTTFTHFQRRAFNTLPWSCDPCSPPQFNTQ